MKKITNIILISLILMFVNQAKAQNLIAVQNGSSARFFEQLDDAIVNAADGDTIYLPGGIFPINQSINKMIHIIGVGYNVDSTKATLSTKIYGSINVESGGSNGSLTGVYLTGAINSGSNVSNYVVRRTNFTDLNMTSTSNGWVFIENIINGFLKSDVEPGASGCKFSNNLVYGNMGASTWTGMSGIGFTKCIFSNNILMFRT